MYEIDLITSFATMTSPYEGRLIFIREIYQASSTKLNQI